MSFYQKLTAQSLCGKLLGFCFERDFPRLTEERYSQIQNVYPRYDGDVVSSHNDLNPNNILFDGKKIWIIDWEAAFQNDRYVDLANVSRPKTFAIALPWNNNCSF